MTRNTTYYIPIHYHTGLPGFEVQMLRLCHAFHGVSCTLWTTQAQSFTPPKPSSASSTSLSGLSYRLLTPTTSCWCESTSGIVDTTFWGAAGDSISIYFTVYAFDSHFPNRHLHIIIYPPQPQNNTASLNRILY
jgi:hypothetical protein